MEENRKKADHTLVLKNRETGSLTGIREVISFDEKEIQLDTEQGTLTIRGRDLHVKKLTLEQGEMEITGLVDGISYPLTRGDKTEGESLWNRLFH